MIYEEVGSRWRSELIPESTALCFHGIFNLDLVLLHEVLS